MADAGVAQQGPSLLLDLPEPAWRTLLSILPPWEVRKLRGLCRSTLQRSAQAVKFRCAPGLDISPSSRALFRVLLASPQPLSKLCLTADYFDGIVSVTGLLEQVTVAAHAARGAQWHGAAGLKELELEGIPLTAKDAKLLPQAFPQLTSLCLTRCKQHTAALLRAMRSFRNLSHLTLTDPKHSDPDSLWAAAVAEANAAGDLPSLQAAAKAQGGEPGAEAEGRSAAATGYLLSPLQGITSLNLDIPWAPAAFRLLVLKGTGSRLTAVELRSWGLSHKEAEVPALLTPALKACTSLRSLDLVGELGNHLAPVLAACPSLNSTLRSLSLPWQKVEQQLLDVILQYLPALEHLEVNAFQGLTESRWTEPCLWRSLKLRSSDIAVRTLAYIPLHSLEQPLKFDSLELVLDEGSPAEAAALVEAARANLARCRPGVTTTFSVTLRAPHSRTPTLLLLLGFFTCTEYLNLYIKRLGVEELACLAEVRSFVSGVKELAVASGSLRPGLLTPDLWAVMPALKTLRLIDRREPRMLFQGIVDCVQAAPRFVVVKMPWVQEPDSWEDHVYQLLEEADNVCVQADSEQHTGMDGMSEDPDTEMNDDEEEEAERSAAGATGDSSQDGGGSGGMGSRDGGQAAARIAQVICSSSSDVSEGDEELEAEAEIRGGYGASSYREPLLERAEDVVRFSSTSEEDEEGEEEKGKEKW